MSSLSSGDGGAGQLVVRQVEVAHGGRHVTVSEQALDGVDVDTGFQQVGGETVAQGVNAARTPKPGFVSRSTIHALRSLGVYRPDAGWVGEQPSTRATQAPVIAQGFQQSGRKHRVAITVALALAHLDAHTVWGALDVRRLQRTHFRYAQPRSVSDHQQGAGAQVRCRCKHPGHLVPRQDARQGLGHLRHRNIEPALGLPQHPVEQEAAGAGNQIYAGVSELALDDQMQEVILHLLR